MDGVGGLLEQLRAELERTRQAALSARLLADRLDGEAERLAEFVTWMESRPAPVDVVSQRLVDVLTDRLSGHVSSVPRHLLGVMWADASRSWSPVELSGLTGLSRSTVRSNVRRMEQRGLVVRTRYGHYLPAPLSDPG